ncbi:MAG: hypothetical protein KC766_34755, partial [Myxococcales bacterium]|nr:hypothetical protein [Myxococcales bacterium]
MQSNKDRFIARDLAIYMLATAALNDSAIVGYPSNTLSCAAAYAHAASDHAWGTQNAQWLFDPSGGSARYFPPFDPTKRTIVDANMPGLAKARLETQTHLLRTGARLLNELIDKSVEADLAGTAKRRTRATDYRRGNETAWGTRNNENGKYNTLGHAIRVIAGRWELSPANLGSLAPFYTTDPKCGGSAAADLLDEKYGKDFTARVLAEAIRTDGQRIATQIVEGAGIVVPKDQLESLGIGPVRSAVAKQLKESASLANGFLATEPTGVAKSVGYALDDVSDADLTFALNRTFNQYRLLTNTDDTATSVATPGPGLQAAAYVTGDLGNLGGVALAGGMPKQDLATDIMSRVAGIQDASQCDEFGGAYGHLYTDSAVRSTFQDSYSIGQALMRRLVLLRESVAPVSEVSDVLPIAQAAVSEARAWTGPGKVIATSVEEREGNGYPGAIWIYTLGFLPEDFAATSTTSMGEQILLAYGPPWVADCAAGIRKECPAGFVNDYVVQATSATVSALTPAEKLLYGYDGTLGTFVFPGQSGTHFHPNYVDDGTTDENHVYVILAHDPKNPAAGGKVLGSVALHHPLVEAGVYRGGTAVVVSEKQRKHFNDILGIGSSYRDKTGVGTRTLSEGPAYCIDGVDKDPFVPLENELTSDSDQYENSWKHYLTLARQAAAKADDLGQKLVDIGLQQEFRREAASEELAQICGDFSSVDKLDVSDGQVKLKPPEDDENLKSCLDEETYDVVFLTNDPTPLIGEEQVKDKIGCNSSPSNPNPECSGTLKTAGLNL